MGIALDFYLMVPDNKTNFIFANWLLLLLYYTGRAELTLFTLAFEETILLKQRQIDNYCLETLFYIFS